MVLTPRRPRRSGHAGDRAGVAAIEFAVMAPLLLVVIASVVELGLATRDTLRVQSAAAAGAQYAMLNGYNAAGISAAVVSGTGAVGLSASPAPTLFCGCPTATGIGATACTATCDDGVKLRQYIRISASIQRTTVLHTQLGLPDILVRQAIVRLP